MARQNPKRPARRRAKWHQAFVDALHTGLRRYRDVLELLPEFPLTSEPMRLDLLIIKKQPGAVINKSICRGFLGHNLIEYKNPYTSVSVRDFIKANAYISQYASGAINNAKLDDVTFTFVAGGYSRNLLRCMKDAWGCKIREIAPGIRATMVGIFPFQLVESGALSEDDDILLSSLRPGLDADRLQRVLDVSEAEGGSMDYLMTVAEANPEAMEEIIMRKATMRNSVLYDIVSRSPLGEDLVKKGIAEGEAKGIAKGQAEGKAEGKAEGVLETTLRFARSLAQQGVSFDIIKNSTGFTEAELAKLGIVR